MITEQIFCVAVALYFEASVESFHGQLQIANVIQNRVESPRYPNTPCKVIKQDKQFSFLNGIHSRNMITIKNYRNLLGPLTTAVFFDKYKPKYHSACHYATIEINNNWTMEYDMVFTTMWHSFYEGGC